MNNNILSVINIKTNRFSDYIIRFYYKFNNLSDFGLNLLAFSKTIHLIYLTVQNESSIMGCNFKHFFKAPSEKEEGN